MKNILLLSSSKYKETGYLEHALPWLQQFLADYRGKKSLLFLMPEYVELSMSMKKLYKRPCQM
ncbi:peptidase E [Rodentibacter pneumotropicus]|uniref:Peptidase E n=1 Tax=Rodentibacter pneumotropicus TaxID=758 RepID=A0A448MIY7_9PAST|nr:peptidase E [Rodentibacter pneumotropicus]